VKRGSLVLEIYNPYSIVQVSEMLSEVTVRSGDRHVYRGRAVVDRMLNTGLMAVVSMVLIDQWSDMNEAGGDVARVGDVASAFVDDWNSRFKISRSYQVAISEMRAFLAETSRWSDQAELSDALPREGDQRLREDVFYDMAAPLMVKGREYLVWLEDEASRVPADDSVAHRNFAQSALHPLLLRAPFVYRTFAKPLGYAGDYEMVNQILSDPRQGDSTYFQLVNTMFLQSAVAQAHRNRVDILKEYLDELAHEAVRNGGRARVLNVGCGPAAEIQRVIASNPDANRLDLTLVDFSEETLQHTRTLMEGLSRQHRNAVDIDYVHQSVHELLKRAGRGQPSNEPAFDFIYCAGLFDYLSDKVCARLLQYFASRCRPGGRILVTNVHSANPERNGMEHLLEWHLIYRDEKQLENVLPEPRESTKLFTDATGVNVFADFRMPQGTVAQVPR